MRAWVDASTLIALDGIGRLSLLKKYFGRVAITPAIEGKVMQPKASPELRRAVGKWIEVEEVSGNSRSYRALGLDRGEASLLLTPEEDLLILDEEGGRRAAAAEGRRVTGLLGVLIGSVRDGVLDRREALDVLEALASSRFHMSLDLMEKVRKELEVV